MSATHILERIREALQGQVPRTRFAPSPTGYLHMGHVVHALQVWGVARAVGAQVVLRMENHDRIRCKPEFESALLEDLEWLGLMPDLGLPAAFQAGECAYRQSDCEADYRAALARLQSQGLVYACDCSRKRILERTGEQASEELRYDGFCRDRNLVDASGMTLRLRLPDEVVEFDDVALGPQRQQPASQIGDVAIRDNHGHWSYQFAVVCDDIRQDIHLIVRGMDILSSTGRQILMRRLLGENAVPIYMHHPLLVDAQGRKLSKRDFDADIHALNVAGEHAESVIGKAVYLAGWKASEAPISLDRAMELIQSIYR